MPSPLSSHASCWPGVPLLKKHLLKSLLWLGISAGVLLLALVSPRWRARSENAPKAETGARRSGGGTEVETLRVKPAALDETLQLTGTLRADETIEVQAESAGKITGIHFTEGTAVRRDDLLLKINDAELVASLQRATARRELAQVKARRLARLLENGGINQQDFDSAQSEFIVQEAEVRLIRAQLDKTEIRAPFDGLIGLRFVSAGSLVTPSTRIATLQSVNRLKLDFTVPERHAARLQPGVRVEFTVSGDRNRHQGEVYAVEPRIDEATRTLLVRARVDNAAGALRPGALAEVTLILQHWEQTLLVPAMAVVSGEKGKTVFVVEADRAEIHRVETGLRRQELVQITSGLQPGDEVVVGGVQLVKSGAAVRTLRAR